MNIRTSSVSYQNEYPYKILGDLVVKISIDHNPYDLSLETLFKMAARKNKKRGFLFVSNLLGKHIPVAPTIPLLSSRLLAHRFIEQVFGGKLKNTEILVEAIKTKKNLASTYNLLKEEELSLDRPMTFIGFAETATALGHGLFDCFNDAKYIHTTREDLLDVESVITFEEEHSHATSHRCYALEEKILKNDNPIVLIDDEMTTGKTTINIIKSIQKRFPRKDYYVVSLLDWRSAENAALFDELMEEHNINIQAISLLKGKVEVKGSPVTSSEVDYEENIIPNDVIVSYHTIDTPFKSLPYTSINGAGSKNDNGYLLLTGRFGVANEERKRILKAAEDIGKQLQSLRKGAITLCLGTGEFVHFPMAVAVYMGEGVAFQSTTRSPIHPVNREDYAVKQSLSFNGPTDPSVKNFVYNIPKNYYDEIFLFFEREESPQQLDSIKKELSKTGIKALHIITFN